MLLLFFLGGTLKPICSGGIGTQQPRNPLEPSFDAQKRQTSRAEKRAATLSAVGGKKHKPTNLCMCPVKLSLDRIGWHWFRCVLFHLQETSFILPNGTHAHKLHAFKDRTTVDCSPGFGESEVARWQPALCLFQEMQSQASGASDCPDCQIISCKMGVSFVAETPQRRALSCCFPFKATKHGHQLQERHPQLVLFENGFVSKIGVLLGLRGEKYRALV